MTKYALVDKFVTLLRERESTESLNHRVCVHAAESQLQPKKSKFAPRLFDKCALVFVQKYAHLGLFQHVI